MMLVTSNVRNTDCYRNPAQLRDLDREEAVVDEMLDHILPSQLALLDQTLHVGEHTVGQVKVLLQVKR